MAYSYLCRFISTIGGFDVTSSPPCWWTVHKRSLISSLCLSTSICSFHHCYLCLPRLHENYLYLVSCKVAHHFVLVGFFLCVVLFASRNVLLFHDFMSSAPLHCLYTLVPAARLFSRAACLVISLGTGVSKSCSRRISFWDWGEYDDFSRVVGLVAAFGARLEIIFAHILAFPARAIRGAAYQWKFSYYCLNTSPWQWMTTAC